MIRLPGRDRGFALLLVLWTMVLLSLLVTQMVSAGRTEAQLTSNLRGAAVAEAAADGAVHQAMFRLLQDRPALPPELRLPGAVVALVIENEAGKVNPNSATPELLAALLRAVGADTRTATAIAAAIVSWRFPGGDKAAPYRAAGREYGPPGAPFRRLDEIGLVLGITPALLGRVLPHLSLYSEAEPNAAAAGPVVLQAMRAVAGGQVTPASRGAADAPRAVTILATAATDTGARFTRRAVILLRSGETLYQVMEWDASS